MLATSRIHNCAEDVGELFNFLDSVISRTRWNYRNYKLGNSQSLVIQSGKHEASESKAAAPQLNAYNMFRSLLLHPPLIPASFLNFKCVLLPPHFCCWRLNDADRSSYTSTISYSILANIGTHLDGLTKYKQRAVAAEELFTWIGWQGRRSWVRQRRKWTICKDSTYTNQERTVLLLLLLLTIDCIHIRQGILIIHAWKFAV